MKAILDFINEIIAFLKKPEFFIPIGFFIGVTALFMQSRIFFIMLSLAAFATGGVLGFLFGIPIYDSSLVEHKDSKTNYRSNTNLEQISDWLTKILVGVGLTQLPNASTYLSRIITYIEKSQKESNDKALILTIIIYFFIVGFMGGYLWSRLYLKKAFEDADSIQKKLDQADKRDSFALSNVFLHLSGEKIAKNDQTVFDILSKSLSQATQTARINVYYQAHEIRRNNSPFATVSSELPSEINIYRMERCIEVFKALIQTYQDSRSITESLIEPIDRYHGELGYALKDKRNPDWENALFHFNKAIDYRDNTLKRASNIKWFELNRIYCWINLEKNRDKDYKHEILHDLSASINSASRLRTIINNTFLNKRFESTENENNYEIYSWLDNKIKEGDKEVIDTLHAYIEKYGDELNNLQSYLESFPEDTDEGA